MRGLYRRKGSTTWYVLIYHEGKRVRASTGTASKKEAQQFYDDFCAKLRAQGRQSGTTWEDACVKWLTAADRSGTDRYILRALQYENRPLAECSAESFEQALAHLSNATYNRYRAILVAICNLSGHKIKLPMKRAKGARLRFLTRQEWDSLRGSLPAHLAPLAAFSLATGLRQANVLGLRWDQIDLQAGRMWIHADQAKGGKSIGVPLSKDALALLRSQIGRDKEWVFPYKGKGRKAGAPMAKIKTAWHAALERAGLGHYETKDGKRRWVGDFTWHGLRHTWASWHLMAGTPIEVLKELGGWQDLRMVEKHYGHLAADHLASFADNAKPWGREQPQTTATAA